MQENQAALEAAESTPLPELQGRLRRLQEKLQESDIEAALIVQNTDLFYFTGTIQRSHLFVPAEGPPLLMVRKSLARAKAESSIRPIVSLAVPRQIPSVLAEHGFPIPTRLGLELDVLPADLYLHYRKIFHPAQIVDVSSAIRQLRAVKSDYEIDQIRRACRMADRLAAFVPSVLTEGMREVDFAGLVEAEARRLGHHGTVRMRAFNAEVFYGHLFSGPAGAVPSFLDSPTGGEGMGPALAQSAGQRRICAGEPVIVDYVFGRQGYLADHARVFAIGTLPPSLVSAHESMLAVQAVIAAETSAGICCEDIYRKALAEVHNYGLAGHFMGSGSDQAIFVGHGIGLEIDELPILGKGQKMTLKKNMIIAVEPKAVFPGIGSVGIENMFRVTEDGLERMTHSDDHICSV